MRGTSEDTGHGVYLAPDSPNVPCPIRVSLTIDPGLQWITW